MLFHKSSQQRSPNFLPNRLGLARRLHETLAQDLAAIGYQLDAVIADEKLPNSLRTELRQIRLQVMQSTHNFREEIYKLRNIDRGALQEEISALLSEFQLKIDLSFPLLNDEAEALLAEAVREIARNTFKHSVGKNFYLHFKDIQGDTLLEIGDDGTGRLSLKNGSLGLLGLDEVLRQITDDYTCFADENGTHYKILIRRELYIQ